MSAPHTVEDFGRLVASFSVARTELQAMRKRTRDMQVAILEYMRTHDLAEYDAGEVRLLRKQTKRTEGLKKEHIEGELRRLMLDGVDDAVTNMFNRRVTDVQETLSVAKARTSGSQEA